jgi:predicted phage terminase large subunit-like protein
VIGEREFSALYQQKPMPDEGTFFQRGWFGWYDPREVPECHKYITSDFAVTEDGGDFTSIMTHGVDANDDIYVAMDYWTGQTSADRWIDEICNQILRNKPLAFFGEGGPIRRSIEPFLLKRMRERKAFCRVEWVPSISDKTSRARAIQARASMGKVKLPQNEWGYAILSQLLSFPAGMNDDDVDAMSLLGRVIDEAHPATTTLKAPERKKDRYDLLFENAHEEAMTWRM